jgi:hypothetical protein
MIANGGPLTGQRGGPMKMYQAQAVAKEALEQSAEPLKADPWEKVKRHLHSRVERGDVYIADEVDAAHAADLAKHAAEVGAAYWRGFQQATYNKPGCLTTADELIAVKKEHAADTATIADLRAEIEAMRNGNAT